MRRLWAPLHLFSVLLVIAGWVVGQEKKSEQRPSPPATSLVSPDIHPDGSVTFRFRALNAREVQLGREGAAPVEMQKDDQGVWTVTTAPLAPDYYGYSFMADGARSLDASNPSLVAESDFSGKFRSCSRTALAAMGIERCAPRRDSSSLL